MANDNQSQSAPTAGDARGARPGEARADGDASEDEDGTRAVTPQLWHIATISDQRPLQAVAKPADEQTQPPAPIRAGRRALLRRSFVAALGATLAASLFSFFDFFSPRKVVGFGGVVRVPASLVPAPGADPVSVLPAKAWIVNLKPGEGLPPQFRSFARPSDRGGILALYQKCPHLGCAVPWRPEFDFQDVQGWFRCPCHGSTYTKAGVRVFGPSPRPLDLFAVTVNPDGSLDVDTGKITPGSPENPQRTIRLP